MSTNYVTDIAFGDSGAIWIGTDDGLVRIINDQIELIRENIWVHSLALDTGNLWTTFNDGIQYYNRYKLEDV